jgi:hypothetical protein
MSKEFALVGAIAIGCLMRADKPWRYGSRLESNGR